MGIADAEVAIGFVGRLVMEKGLDVFADTIDQLLRRGIRHRVLIVGDGPAKDWFEKRLPEDAVFAGFQRGPDLGRAVASMDLLFNPSVTETFGNVTLEAMAAGVAGLGAAAARSHTHDTPGVSGAPCRPGAILSFADALARYCESDEARREAGHAGRIASRAYEWDKVNQALVESYLRIERQRERGSFITPGLQRVPWPGGQRVND